MKTKLFTIAVLLFFAAGPALSSTYYIWSDWGGTWADAEKVLGDDGEFDGGDPGEDDDWLCWAAATSNILEYTGWGLVGGNTNTDDIFAEFKDHWTDQGGNSYFGFNWWFDGTNDMQAWPPVPGGWAQEDVDGAGGYYPTLNHDDYKLWDDTYSAALTNLDTWMHDGYGCTIAIPGHQITAWGFDYDPTKTGTNYYTGIWVTDSDDDKTNPPYNDSLRYYDLLYSSGRWYLQDYYGTYNNYITEVCGLAIIPVPGAILLGILGLGTAGMKLRKKVA
jgi:hypothetical protein